MPISADILGFINENITTKNGIKKVFKPLAIAILKKLIFNFYNLIKFNFCTNFFIFTLRSFNIVGIFKFILYNFSIVY